MKKYFKIGTALAFSVLLNFAPTIISNVNAEEADDKTVIVETPIDYETSIEQEKNNKEIIEIEEPIEVDNIDAEETKAEANNINIDNQTRGPNEGSDPNEDLKLLGDSDEPSLETEDIEIITSRVHIMDNSTGTPVEKGLYEYTSDNLGASDSFRLVDIIPEVGSNGSFTKNGVKYTFQGWYTAEEDGTKLTSSAIKYKNVNVKTSSYNGVNLLVPRTAKFIESEDIYLYANYTRADVPGVRTHIMDTRLGDATPSSIAPIIYGSKSRTALNKLLDGLPGDSKAFVIETDDYIYTFKGWSFDEEGTDLVTTSGSVKEDEGYKVTYKMQNAPTAGSMYPGHLVITVNTTPTEVVNINLYALWDVKAAPAKAKINIIDTRIGEDSQVSTSPIRLEADSQLSKELYQLVDDGSFVSTTIDKVTDDNYVYTFDGYYTESGEKLTSNEITINGVKFTANSNDVATSPNALNIKTTSDITADPINIYLRWIKTEKPQVHLMDVKPNGTTEVAVLGGAGINIGLDQYFNENNSDRPYSGIKDPSTIVETDSNHIYTFIGWYKGEEDSSEELTGTVDLTGDYAKLLKSLTVNPYEEGASSPYALTYQANFDYLKIGEEIPNSIYIYGHWDTIEAQVLNYKQENNVTLDENEGWQNVNGTTQEFRAPLVSLTEPNGNHIFLYWKVYNKDEENSEYDHIEYKDSTFVYVFQNDKEHSGSLVELIARAWWQAKNTLKLYKDNTSFEDSNLYSEQSDYTDLNLYGGSLQSEPTKAGYNFLGWYDRNTDEKVTDEVFEAPEASYLTPNSENGDNYPKLTELYAKWERKTNQITITKDWSDTEERTYRPDSIEVELYERNSGELIDTITLKAEEDWTANYTIYTHDEEGNELDYYLDEVEVPSYNSSIDGFNITNSIKNDGTVIVKYLDIETNDVVADPITHTDTIDREYTSVAKEVENYDLVQRPENETVTITEEEQSLIYYYKKHSGDAIIHYIDNRTKEDIYETIEQHGYVDEEYESEIKEIPGYVYKFIIGQPTGNFINNETIDVYYLYEKVATVIVKYVDIDTNDELLVVEPKTGLIGEEYVTEELEFDNYELVKVEGEPNGRYSDGEPWPEPTTITFFYQLMNGNVIVHHIDKENGDELGQNILSDKIGEEYSTTPREDFAYYNLTDPTPDNSEGTYTEEDIDVFYYYIRNDGRVIVHHIAQDTDEEFDTTYLNGKEGEEFHATYIEDYYPYEAINKDNPDADGEFIDGDIEVTFYYAPHKGVVEVHYVDVNNQDEDILYEEKEGKTGEDYTIVREELEGYQFLTSNGQLEGTYSDNLIEKVYFYYQKLGKVIAKYIDQDTNESIADVYENEGIVGEEYTTPIKTITDYELVEVPENANGIYTDESHDEEIEVTYYYVKRNSNLIVHHIDVDSGDDIVEPVETSEKIGTPYESSRLDEEEYGIYDVVRTEGQLSGEYTAEDINVYYYYQKQKGTVTAYYIDNKSLQLIVDPVTTEGYVDETYSTDRTDFSNYRFVNVNDESLESGYYKNGEDIKVYYFYEKIGKVIIKHLENGTDEVLLEVEPKEGPIGSEYTTSPEVIENYHLVGMEGNDVGTYEEEDQIVTYYYEKDVVIINGDLEVNYIDTDGNPIKDYSYTDTKEVGTEYTTEAIEIEGYTYKFKIGEESGEYTEGTTIVTYVYEKNPEVVITYGDLEVNYVDLEGNPIKDYSYTDTKEVGTEYTTEAIEIEGYTYKFKIGEESGEYTEGTTVVTYVYEKNPEVVITYGDLEVNYVDLEGNPIKDYSYTDTKEVGTEYTTEAIEIEGYTYKFKIGEESGEYTEGTTVVTYVYEKNINYGDLKVNYIDTDGNPIEDYSYTDTKEVGTEYTTEAIEIKGYTYKFKIGEESGEYVEGTTTVTYIYEKNIIYGNLEVNYIDTDGNPIKDYSYTDTKEVGTEYTTKVIEIEGYTYKFKIGEESGEYTEGTTTVTYVYEKNPEEVISYGKLEVNYVDTDGNPIGNYSYTDTKEVGVSYSTEELEIDGYTFKFVVGEIEGVYTTEISIVTYVYEKDSEEIEEPADTYVIVHYVSGNTPLADDVIIPGKVGDSYVTQTKAFDGYELVKIRKEVQPMRRGITPDYMVNSYGIMVEGVTVIWYEYEPIKEEEPVVPEKGTVIAHYVDENGNAISGDYVFTAEYGTQYITSQKVIPGYTGTSIPENRVGKIEQELLELYYVYEKNTDEEEGDTCDNNCCNHNCSCNNSCGDGNQEDNQPTINIDITINNDNSTEVNNENNNQDENTNNVDNNNQDETNNNVENNPTNTIENNQDYNNEVTTGDVNIENNPVNTNEASTGDTTVTTGDVNVDPTIENNTTVENNPTVENNTNVETGDNNITTTNEDGDINITTGDNVNNNSSESISEGGDATNGENTTNVDVVTGDNTMTTGDTNVTTGDTLVTTGDNNIETGDTNTNVTTGDTVLENNPTIEANPKIENNITDGDNTTTLETGDTNVTTGEVNNTSSSTTGDVTLSTGEVNNSSTIGDMNNSNNVETGDNNNAATLEGGNASTGEITNNNSSTSEGGNASTGEITNSSDSKSEGGSNENNNTTEIKDNTITNNVEGGNSESSSSNETGDNTTNVETGDINNSNETGDNGTNVETGDINNSNETGDNGTNVETGDNNNTNETGDSSSNNSNNNNNHNNNDNTCADCNTPSEGGDEPTPTPTPSDEIGTVVAYYRTKDGDIVADSETFDKKVNSSYATTEKNIEDYELIEVEGNQTGTVSKGVTEVIYYYQKKNKETVDPEPEPEPEEGKVVAHYVDIYGRMIGYDLEYTGEVGEEYNTKKRAFKGYELVQIVGAKDGQFTSNDQEVTYIYLKKQEEVKPEDNPVCPTCCSTCEGTGKTAGRDMIGYPKNQYRTINEIKVPNTGIESKDNGLVVLIFALIGLLLPLKRLNHNN